MKYEEFRRQLGKAGLTVKAFAQLIKQNPNSVSNYSARGEVPPSLAIMAALMGDMAEAGVDYRATLAKIEFESARSKNDPTKSVFGKKKLKLIPSETHA